MNAGAAALLFGIGALTASSIGQVSRYRRPPVEVDPGQVRAQALADAWWAVHISRHGPVAGGGPDNFYNGAYTAKGCIEGLPGFDKDVEPGAVLAYQQRGNVPREASRSGKIVDGPGGVGSTNRGLTPTTGTDGSEG